MAVGDFFNKIINHKNKKNERGWIEDHAEMRDFPEGPVIYNPVLPNGGGTSLTPGQETKIPPCHKTLRKSKTLRRKEIRSNNSKKMESLQ